jgi:hypothetical protein
MFEMARPVKSVAASLVKEAVHPGCTDNWCDSLPAFQPSKPMLCSQSEPVDTPLTVLGFGKLRGVIVLFWHSSSSDVESFPTLLGLGAGLVWHIK